jgi:hypothetical protein
MVPIVLGMLFGALAFVMLMRSVLFRRFACVGVCRVFFRSFTCMRVNLLLGKPFTAAENE